MKASILHGLGAGLPMDMPPYQFRPSEREEIAGRFGEGFLSKATNDLETYAGRWELSQMELIPSFSANVLFRCRSRTHGDAVLKIGPLPPEGTIPAEYDALRQFGGGGGRICRVYEADPARGVLLLERMQPGTSLREEPSLEKRLAVFSELFAGMHRPPERRDRFPTYTGWVVRIAEYMEKRDDCAALAKHMRHAREMHLRLAARYPRKLLLHGDFHHDNILLGADGRYRVIDPKGVTGDPVFDVPRFLLNEFGESPDSELLKKMLRIFAVLEQSLRIPGDVLRQCLYVETAMGACWMAEDGAGPDECAKLLTHVEFAEALLESDRIRSG